MTQTAKRKKSRPKTVRLGRNKLLKYYLLVLGLAVLYHILSNQPWFIQALQPVFEGYAFISSGILNLLGQDTTAVGKEISSPAFSLLIKTGCDGITPQILYAMAILAFPIPFRYKWKGVLIGLAILVLLNIIRIVSLFFVGKYSSAWFFDFIHVDVWAVGYMVFALFLWLIWMNKVIIGQYYMQKKSAS